LSEIVESVIRIVPTGDVPSLADQRYGSADVVVAGLVEVVVDRRDLELVGAGEDPDRVGARKRVGLLDRGTQRAPVVERPALPVADAGVDGVRGLVDEELGRAGLAGRDRGVEAQRGQRAGEQGVRPAAAHQCTAAGTNGEKLEGVSPEVRHTPRAAERRSRTVVRTSPTAPDRDHSRTCAILSAYRVFRSLRLAAGLPASVGLSPA